MIILFDYLSEEYDVHCRQLDSRVLYANNTIILLHRPLNILWEKIIDTR